MVTKIYHRNYISETVTDKHLYHEPTTDLYLQLNVSHKERSYLAQ